MLINLKVFIRNINYENYVCYIGNPCDFFFSNL